MTEERNEQNQRDTGEEQDLRSIMAGQRSAPAAERGSPEKPAPPRDGSGRISGQPQMEEPERKPTKLPPVWPGDEDQPWFRRERGLPPLPRPEDKPTLWPEDLPTDLADVPTRAKGWLVSVVVPNAISVMGAVGQFIALLLFLVNLMLYRQGQDLGALALRMRVLRDNGDVAGFYHMWTRSAAAVISLLAFGAGYWTAFSDPERRTWHDKWLGTYVVKDAPDYKTRRRSSSGAAVKWFWITLVLFIVITIFAAMLYAEAAEAPAQ